MLITKFLHSCLVLEKDSERILIDPGKFSFVEKQVDPAEFSDISAIFLTHYHPDHIYEEGLDTILEKNPGAAVYTNDTARTKLAEKGFCAEVFESGRRVIAGFVVEAIEAPHAAILGDEPPQNTAYLFDQRVLHPGDSYSKNLNAYVNSAVLCLPLMAPWATELDTAEFAERLGPQKVLPIHDGYAKDFFLEQRYTNFDKHFSAKGIEFIWLDKPGTSIRI
jgi:L-ascorbate metabolism protein UlaG (beta-lactamase superfamily)